MKTKENVKNNNFTKLTRRGISLIVLVITIIVIIILAAAIIISLNNNNPIMEANTARYESDRANMQAVFTNAVSKVMAKNQATVSVSAGQINTVTGGVAEIDGQVAYTLTDAQNASNATGTIVFDKGPNTDTKFYTGKKLPIYAAGDTKWYVDSEGNIALEVAGTKYGSGEVIKPKVTLISGPEFSEIIPETTVNIEFLSTAAPEGINVTDLSEKQDGSILGWLDGKTYKVAPKNAGDVIYANSDCSGMFDFTWYDGEEYFKEIFIEHIYLNNFNTSNVTNMEKMFYMLNTSEDNPVIGIENLDVSNVTNMASMFSYYNDMNPNFCLDLSKWNVSNVTDMTWMFYSAGRNSEIFEIKGIENWNTSSLTDISHMFQNVVSSSAFGKAFKINLSKLDVSKVTSTHMMFSGTARYVTTFEIGNLSNWNLTNMNDMSNMFSATAQHASSFYIGDISVWDVSNVRKMDAMFYEAGQDVNYTLNLSAWKDKISNVQSYRNFDYKVESKIISPWD